MYEYIDTSSMLEIIQYGMSQGSEISFIIV